MNRTDLGKAEEIAERLRMLILNGHLSLGAKMASERELSDQFSVSRMTIRHALELMEAEGLVSRHPGRGTYIGGIRERVLVSQGREMQQTREAPSIAASELRRSGSFIKDMKRIGRKPQVQFIEQPSLVPADSQIAQSLQIQEGTLVLKRYRLQLADNLPYRLIESYYPSDLFGELLTINIGEKPLFEWLQERHNLRVAHAQEILLARLATQNERQLLRISPTSPVVSLERTVWTDTRRPIEWAQIIAIASLYLFTYEYDIFEWNKEQKHDNRVQVDQSTPQ
ncbi:MAG TPA: GntR family transcriptional regulator [Ktedonobacteraceae bacterium]